MNKEHGVASSGDPRRDSGAREIFWFVVNPKNASELSTGNGRHGLSPRLWDLTWKGRLKGGFCAPQKQSVVTRLPRLSLMT